MLMALGSAAINSTYAPVASPSTATLIAELDSTQLGTHTLAAGQKLIVRAMWILGADTNTTWQIESCASTALNDGVDISYPKTPTGASGQFMTSHSLFKDYRLRARCYSAGSTQATALISCEIFT